MPINRWERRVDRSIVVVPFGSHPLRDVVDRLYKQGCVEINLQQERGTNKWHIEAVRFIMVKEGE